jgi:hypothetical protein
MILEYWILMDQNGKVKCDDFFFRALVEFRVR